MAMTERDTRTMKIMRTDGVRRPSLRMGATTQQFFIEGAEHEATQWEHAQLPPDDEVENSPPLGFTSFDKIPRKRGPLLSVLAIGVFLVIGSLAWAMSLNRLTGGRAVKDWVVSTFPNRAHLLDRFSRSKPVPPTQSEPVASAAPVAQTPPAEVAAPPVAASPQAAPAATTATKPATAPAPEAVVAAPAVTAPPVRAAAAVAAAPVVAAPVAATPAVVAEPVPETSAVAAPPADSEKVATDSAAHDYEPARRSHALKGFVWSPEAGRLVPARPADESAPPE